MMLHVEKGREKTLQIDFVIALFSNWGERGARMVKLPRRGSLNWDAGARAAPAGGDEGCEEFPVLFLRRHDLTFGGTGMEWL